MTGWRMYADAGNTALKWAAREGGRWLADGRIESEALPAAGTDLAGVLAVAGLDPDECTGAALVCSRPLLAGEAERVLAAATGMDVRLLGRELQADVPVEYRDPEEIGQDRLAAAEGAISLVGAPVIVMTLGTCITAQAVDPEGTLTGGAIAAGVAAQVRGIAHAVPHLSEAAADARKILRSDAALPESGRSTVESLVLGLAASLRGTVAALIEDMQTAIGEAPVIATGGDAELASRLQRRQAGSLPHVSDESHAMIDRVEPLLVLEGLRVVDERT